MSITYYNPLPRGDGVEHGLQVVVVVVVVVVVGAASVALVVVLLLPNIIIMILIVIMSSSSSSSSLYVTMRNPAGPDRFTDGTGSPDPDPIDLVNWCV